ncbi:MAG TPA: enoyl-CoA hydratase-related protein [Candidatus Limnocylindria bacterium]|nr:enoyl-CoA hydratase-related protein [Candidatus Limnocylindria bacterium]
MSELLRVAHDHGVARVTLARPEVRNAMNAALIAELAATFRDLAEEAPEALRAIVLAGDGESFCAGADVAWMRASLDLSVAQNEADAARLAEMLEAIDSCPVPVIARVQGAALGGGMGLCAVADVVVATADTIFGFTETRLGILPAVISPFVLRRTGEGPARALFPTGERFGAERARQIGLVQEVLPDLAALDERIEEITDAIRSAGPTAVRAAKVVILDQRGLNAAKRRQLTVQAIARQRTSAEGQEGLTAFLEKRPPTWEG